MNPTAQMTDLAQIKQFILAGHATFTLVSKLTGSRKTFRIERAPDRPGQVNAARAGQSLAPLYFVRMLVGPDNTSDYQYLGCFGADYSRGFKLNNRDWAVDSGAVVAWMLKQIYSNSPKLFEQAEFWHAGQCGKCGRTLTTPESVARGLGPTCAGVA